MMKRIALFVVFVLALGACLSAVAEAPGMMTGGWEAVPAEAGTLPEEVQAAFEKATAELDGVSFIPVALLSQQVVAGMNYCVLCQVSYVVPDAVPRWELVYIYADLEGGAQIMNEYELYIDKHAQPAE